MNSYGITTSRKPTKAILAQVKQLVEDYDLTYVPRNNRTLANVINEGPFSDLFVLLEQGLQYDHPNGTFVFHPGMSGMRLKSFRMNGIDHMVSAMALANGHKVLDCTMGLASDAIVASYHVGKTGIVVALEKSFPIFLTTMWGLGHYQAAHTPLREAMRRIICYHVDYQAYLAALRVDDFDVIYFDPMFDHALKKSSGIAELRHFASFDVLRKEVVAQALHVAKRVVIKHRSGAYPKDIFDLYYGGKSSPVAYGVYVRGGQ